MRRVRSAASTQTWRSQISRDVAQARRQKQAPPPDDLTDLDLFSSLCVADGLPAPVKEYRFHPVRKWRFDYAWPAQMVALEVEGGVWTGGRHTRGKGYVADLEKYREAAIAGWCVLRVTPAELKAAAVDLVRRAMLGGSVTSRSP